MKKILALILICFTLILSFPNLVYANSPDIDYKTLYQDRGDVTIEKDGRIFYVKEKDSILFTGIENIEYVYTTSNDLNIRSHPSIDYNEYKTLESNTKLVRVATSYTGWSIVLIQGEYYFIWDEFLTTEKPESYSVIGMVEKKNSSRSYYGSKKYLGEFKLTFYCHCEKCNGKWAWGPLANGGYPVQGRTVAMNDVPLGTKLLVNGNLYIVEDRGTPYGHIDVFRNSHAECYKLGVQYADVYLVK